MSCKLEPKVKNTVALYTGDMQILKCAPGFRQPRSSGQGVYQCKYSIWLALMGDIQCNDVDECTSNPCKNGGRCINGVDSWKCKCRGAYTGNSCSVANKMALETTGTIVKATILAGGEAWFTLPAQAGKTYELETVLISLPDSTMTLYKPDGLTQIVQNKDKTLLDQASMIKWKCPPGADGTYVVKVTGENGWGSFGIRAALSGIVSSGGAWNPSAGTIPPQRTELVPDAIRSTFAVVAAGKMQWFSMKATAGQKYKLETELITGTGTLADSVVALYDSTGSTKIAENDNVDGFDKRSLLEWPCHQSGDYRAIPPSSCLDYA